MSCDTLIKNTPHRHLPEYRALKANNDNANFLQILKSPRLVAECTLQPVRRYDLDAAILFSDILVLIEALGVEVTMPGGVGIQVPNPVASEEEAIALLDTYAEQMTPSFVENKLSHVLEAINLILVQLQKEDISIPLIGFSAMPYTLMYYMIGGSSKKNTNIGNEWLKAHPATSHRILDMLTNLVIEYSSCQVKGGVHCLQFFEAMGMMVEDESL